MSQLYGSVSAELADALATYRDRIALRDRQLRLSYGELAAFVTACQTVLAPHQAVAVYGAPGALFGATATACVIAGCPFVHLDPAMPNAVLANIVAELGIGLILTSQPPKAGQLPEECEVIDAATLLGGPAVQSVTPALIDPTDTIYLVATSGTTGRPKCIPVTHDAAFLSYRWRDAYTPYRPDMKIGVYIFAIWEMFRPLRSGAEVCFPGLDDLLSPQALVRFMGDHDLHEMLFTPSFFEKMLQGLDHETAAALPLCRIILNGEVVSDRLNAEARAKLPGVALWNLYSICETHDICMSELTAPVAGARGVTVGKAMQHLRAVVLDDNDRPCPTGVPGLLHFEGDRMLGPGYINRPEETSRRFRELVIEGRPARLYDTGDQGFVTETGDIVVLGRVAHMLKLRGHSIQTRELTETLAGLIGFSHAIPWVQQVADQGQALVFYYTADAAQMTQNDARWHISPDSHRIPETLAEALRAVLPAYCVPSYLVRLDEIPIHQVSGKCDYKALPAIHVEQATDIADTLPVIAHAARVMSYAISDIDPDRSFLDQGGDSLMCVDLIVALEKDYGVRVDFDWALNLPLARLHQLLSTQATTSPHTGFERKGIFLTGATGFLGRHVLAEAAKHLPEDQVIYCLVRAGNEDPQQRLESLARSLNLPEDRIALVAGTIDMPRFGLEAADYAALSRQITSVIHCAATVNLAVERAQMEQWSRAGIANILDLCRDAGADLRFSSSSAVFPEHAGPHPERIALPYPDCSGYAAAKIEAEEQIVTSGVPATIVRLPSLYDLELPNPKDLYENILTACRDAKCLPKALAFPMIDVRAAAAFLVRTPPSQGASFRNLIADQQIAIEHVPMGYTVLPKSEWLARVRLPDLLRKLIADSPHILDVEATLENAAAKSVWQQTGLGSFSRLSDPTTLLADRLPYHNEPALT
ncbi:AMP-binding protein [Paracoccus aestuariivivens]|uniref:AMP-binding protein n=1 Tax=Paracoccus aestuariivivens TaxID=1820333 RepID=A0A6L6JBK0_9RHOB|nr:AMP-binding protein [Paracoccus aestuariivivens]MTH78007.1 AMP-binding protein [Paracoccus aestuariivivens]